MDSSTAEPTCETKCESAEQPIECKLYRHFAADGVLLYVGISLSPTYRLAQHRASSDWFGQIARVEIESFSSKEEALAAERMAIASEKPRYNRAGTVLNSEVDGLIAQVREELRHDTDVMLICDELERRLIKPSRTEYMREYMRNRRRAERAKQ